MKPTTNTLHRLSKSIAVAATFACTAGYAFAGYQGHQPGPLLTLGKTTHPSTMLSLANNPASGELLIRKEESFRMGYWSSFGADYELGDLDNVDQDIEELEDLLEDDEENPLTIDRALEAKAKFDELLPELGEKMNLALNVGTHIPFFPIGVRSEFLEGVIGFNVSAALLTDVIFLDAPLNIENSGSEVSLNTDSSLYLKSAQLLAGSIGYSREIWQPNILTSKIYGGININAYQAKLNKQVISFEAAADDDDDIGDVVSDEFEENTESTTAVGIDLGFIWAFPNGQAGITFTNINEPEFEFGEIGSNCNQLSGLRQKNCLAAQTFSDEIDLKETAVLNAQTTVEGSVFTKDQQFLFSAAADLNSAYSLVGRESQMVSGAVSYFPDSYWIPSVRLGTQKNLAGSELTTVSGGLTLFGVLNLDVAMSLDRIEYDGDEVPRSLGFNIGIEEKF